MRLEHDSFQIGATSLRGRASFANLLLFEMTGAWGKVTSLNAGFFLFLGDFSSCDDDKRK